MHAIFRVWTALAVGLVAWSPLSALEDVYDWRQGRELHPGIRCVRVEAYQPRKMVVHGARIDTWMPDMQLRTSPRRAEWIEGKTETDRQTPRDFLRQSRAEGRNMVLAVNADAFSPWPAPYNQSTPTDLLGLAVSAGTAVSHGVGTLSLLELKSGAMQIAATTPDTDITNVRLAVSGFALCLDNGQPIDGGNDLHPRTGLGLSEDQRYLVLVAIDGRQLLLNVEQRATAGEAAGKVTVALLDQQGTELPGFGFADSIPLITDAIRSPVKWKTQADLSSIRNKTVRVALRLRGPAIVYALAIHENLH